MHSPFPPDDARARAATLRATVRRLRTPDFGFLYFPEGRMHPAPEGLDPFEGDLTDRLGRILSDATWVALGIQLAFGASDKPDARLSLGTPHAGGEGDLRAHLERAMARCADYAQPTRTLLGGAPPPQDRWSFGWMRGFFDRYV